MKTHRIPLALVAALSAVYSCMPAPAFAAQRLTLLASAAQTATANGAAFNVPSVKEMLVCVDTTAVSGTTPQMSVFLQTSTDGGTTWFDMPYVRALLDDNTDQADTSGTEAKRNINGAAVITATTTTWDSCATYEGFGDTVRARWVISGTTPSFTFSVKAVVK